MRGAKIGAYVVLGAALVFTRAFGLDRSFWLDEMWTVEDFVRAGPGQILAGHYIPNNHQLFSMLGWATTSLVGESEVALRLLSVVPFIAGVVLVTAWLQVRVDALSGVTFLFFATASPLLLDITRQARGYGLAFAAMSAMVVCALELRRTRDTWLVAGFCVAGAIGTCTLPNFGVAFVAIAALLLTDPALRTRMGLGFGAALLVCAAWYAPHVDDLFESSRQAYGVEIGLKWLITAPIDQVLIPAFIWIDGVVLFPGPRWIPVVVALLVLIGSSPLLRDRHTALTLAAGPTAMILTLWVTDTRAVPRFLSYLLVPLFMLLASGIASILQRLRSRPQIVRTVIAFVVLVLVAFGFATTGADVVRLPREDHRSAARAIASSDYATAPVYARQVHPRTTEFYLRRPVIPARSARWLQVACDSSKPVAIVVQPWVLPPARVPCEDRPGVRRYRFEQYTRGNEIVVWLIPGRPIATMRPSATGTLRAADADPTDGFQRCKRYHRHHRLILQHDPGTRVVACTGSRTR
jgi:hypothetical protein